MLLFCLAALVFILFWQKFYSRFRKYGVKHFQPFPMVGNYGQVILRQKFFGDVLSELYTQFPEERFVGNYELLSPVILIRDIELLKKIAIQDHDYFIDHRVFISDDADPYFGRTLFMLRGQEWKDMRSTLSPAFSNSKLKQMLPFMVEVGQKMVGSLKKNIEKSDTYFIDKDVKDMSNRFANDIVASCAFGLKVDSISEPENDFYRMGYKASNFSFLILLKFFGYYSVPCIMKVSFLATDTRDFFKQLTLNTMKEREMHSIKRSDMIHLLMEARKTWKDVDLIAQAILFIIAGYETISTTMSFLLHELALNPDVQDRLAREIRDHDKMGGKLEYDDLQSMTYLNMVLSELLRLWPPAVASDRICSKNYNLGRPNDKATEDFIVRAGEDVLIPIMAIHRDPNFFPDPLKFNPERFSEDNKHKILPFTYIPFGLGPRNCIGYRFAVCGVKTLAYHLLKDLEVVTCERTTIPTELSTESFTLQLKEGHWLRLKKRRCEYEINIH